MSVPAETSLAPTALSPPDADRLDALVADAVTRQRVALDRAIDGGLHHLPRLLRAPVRKVLFR